MKKYSIVVIVVCIITKLLTSVYHTEKPQRTLLLENVEALADGDEGEFCGETKICWLDIDCDEGKGQLSTTYYCGTCTEKPYVTRANQHVCRK